MDRSDWLIVAIAAGAALIMILAALIVRKKREMQQNKRADRRPGFRDVIVRDAVDVSTQLYVNEKGEFFPGPDATARAATVVSGAAAAAGGRWNIQLTDTRTGSKKCTEFTSILTIGRAPDVKGGERSLAIYDDTSVSKEHCVIRSMDSGLVISDLNSRNGTYINGKKLRSPVAVNTGDRLAIGNSEYVLEIHGGK